MFDSLTPLVNAIARGVVTRVDDSSKLQLVQIGVCADEPLDDVERFQQYGFSSVPIVGAEAVILSPGGEREQAIVICVGDRRYRLTGLADGEVALYNNAGASVVLRADGNIDLVPGAGGKVRLGSDAATDPVARKSDLDAIKSAISGAAILANDGGATLQVDILADWPTSVGATKVDAV